MVGACVVNGMVRWGGRGRYTVHGTVPVDGQPA